MAKSAGYHGVDEVKYVLRNAEESTIKNMKYAKNISLNVLLNAIEQYADDRLIFRLPKDDGYEGELGTTAQDIDLEKDLGYLMESDAGQIRTGLVNYNKVDIYYEFQEADENGINSKTKVWLFNVEIGKANQDHTGDESTIEFGTWQYPIRVYGTELLDATGEGTYLDENGMKRIALMYVCRKGDAGYDTFGDSVPVAKAKNSI